eukprot:9715-Chlamydomonas_euryale.AAC.1
MAALARCLAFDARAAGMLSRDAYESLPPGERLGAHGGGSSHGGVGARSAHAPGADAAAQPPGSDVEQASALGTASCGGGEPSSAAAPSAAAAVLPRIPPALLHVASVRAYEAVASVARTLGHLARATDTGWASGRDCGAGGAGAGGVGGGTASVGSGANLRRLVDHCLSQLSSAASPASARRASGDGAEPEQDAGLGDGDAAWQLAVAPWVVLTSEVLFGASDAWAPPFGHGAAGATEGGRAAGGGGVACTTRPETHAGAAAAPPAPTASPIVPGGLHDERVFEQLVLAFLQE